MYSSRLDAKLNKWANWLDLLQALVAMWIDVNLDNKSAYITYPIIFSIYLLAIHNWAEIGEGNTAKPLTGAKAKIVATITIIASLLFSAGINYIGFQNFTFKYWLTTIVFAMSLIANIYSAFKLDTQWDYWIIYNLVQLVKSIVQGNIPNVFKYIIFSILLIVLQVKLVGFYVVQKIIINILNAKDDNIVIFCFE